MTAVVEGSAVVVSRSVAELLGAGVEPGSLVWAVTVERGPLLGWLVVEKTADGRDRRCAVVMPDACAVVVAGPISGVQVSGNPIPTDDVMPEWVSALAGQFWATEQVRTERDLARRQVRADEERLERIVDAAHDYANDNDLCSRFDQFMQSQGLRPRSREWVCEVDATVRVRISISSHSAEAAASEVDDDMVVAALSQLRGRLLADALRDHDVVDTEEG